VRAKDTLYAPAAREGARGAGTNSAASARISAVSTRYGFARLRAGAAGAAGEAGAAGAAGAEGAASAAGVPSCLHAEPHLRAPLDYGWVSTLSPA
jgi:hypothetical protein